MWVVMVGTRRFTGCETKGDAEAVQRYLVAGGHGFVWIVFDPDWVF